LEHAYAAATPVLVAGSANPAATINRLGKRYSLAAKLYVSVHTGFSMVRKGSIYHFEPSALIGPLLLVQI
jgi:hypothetical protein